jgi:predicted enzyme related to lactoylglutathione lyase
MGCAVVQWQMVVKDPEAQTHFYSSLFDWRVNSDNPLGYRVVDTGNPEGIDGGVWPSPPEGHNLVQLFIRVDSVRDYVSKAERLGARTIIGPQTLPEGDVLAILQDPQGLSFGLIGR